jgi:hypothetical protein
MAQTLTGPPTHEDSGRMRRVKTGGKPRSSNAQNRGPINAVVALASRTASREESRYATYRPAPGDA